MGQGNKPEYSNLGSAERRLVKAMARVEHIGTEIVTCGADRTAFAVVLEAAGRELRRAQIEGGDPLD